MRTVLGRKEEKIIRGRKALKMFHDVKSGVYERPETTGGKSSVQAERHITIVLMENSLISLYNLTNILLNGRK